VVLFVVLGVVQWGAGSAVGAITGGNKARLVDRAGIEATIAGQLKRAFPDLRVGSVACPKGVKLVEGVSFQCAADVAGGQLPITVTLSHVNTSTGAFDYNFKWTKAVIDTDKVVKGIQARLPQQAANATVDCGTPRVRVVAVGGAIECTVSQGSNRQVIRVVVDDVAGRAHLEPA
jgi:hypothetical protein